MNLICCLLAIGFSGTSSGDDVKACCKQAPAASQMELPRGGPDIPDIVVFDQNGRRHHLFSDLIEGKTVAISFIFTTCTTICPPIGANFAKLEKALGPRAGSEIQLLSISVDPLTDTPQRLKAWKEQFGGGEGWTLVTGAKTEIDKALKAVQFFTADKTDHSPFLLLGNQKSGVWQRINGFAEPARLVEALDGLVAAPQPVPAEETHAAARSSAAKYFTDIPLVDQDGVTHKLFSGLMEDKIVVVQSFFASCKGVCPHTVGHFREIQEHLGDRLGKDVVMLSITVDPVNDTPERLRDYAADWKARPGWYFLSGEPGNVRAALNKFGQMVEQRENHSNIFVIGNVRTGLWKKAFGLADTASIIEVLDGVLADHG